MDNSYKIFGQYFNDIGITFRQHFHWFLRPWAWKGQGELKTLLLSLLMIHWHMIWCGLILYSKVWCDIFPVANKEMKFAFCLLSLFIAFLRTTWLSTIHYPLPYPILSYPTLSSILSYPLSYPILSSILSYPILYPL